MRSKKEIRMLVGEGQLAEAVHAAVAYAEAAADVATLNGLLLLQSDVKTQQATWDTGQLSYEE